MTHDSRASSKGVGMDTRQAVKELLEQVSEPRSVDQIVATLKNALDVTPDDVRAALAYWRSQGEAVQVADGRWRWRQD